MKAIFEDILLFEVLETYPPNCHEEGRLRGAVLAAGAAKTIEGNVLAHGDYALVIYADGSVALCYRRKKLPKYWVRLVHEEYQNPFRAMQELWGNGGAIINDLCEGSVIVARIEKFMNEKHERAA